MSRSPFVLAARNNTRGVHTWWDGLSRERYWLEVTGRPDVGADLKAPQTNERGRHFWSYSLVKAVEPGDIVFHYSRATQSILGASTATGDQWSDKIIWAARGTYARQAGIEPHLREGWYAGLNEFHLLKRPLTLQTIRRHGALLDDGVRELESRVGTPLYFPFENGKKRPLRPMQGYLFKLPSFFVSLFEELGSVPRSPGIGKRRLGAAYRSAAEDFCVGEFDPMQVDSSVVERSNRGHAKTQNELAAVLRALGMEPRSPAPAEPSFDVGWQNQERFFVAEVKSISNANEEKQLRMGLGQVLVYKHRLEALHGREVCPVLALERQPPADWLELCARLNVAVVWSGDFSGLGGSPEWQTH